MSIDTFFETIYIGSDNVIARQLTDNGKAITNHSAITRLIVNIGVYEFDSLINPTYFNLGLTDRIELKLGSAGIVEGKYLCSIKAFTATSTLGTSYPAFLVEVLTKQTSLL